MKKIIIITFLTMISGCSVFDFTKNKENRISFKGCINGHIRKYYDFNSERTIYSKIKISKESKLIKEFLTDKNGSFNEVITVNAIDNPYQITIKGLESVFIDTIMSYGVTGYRLDCKRTIEINQNIDLFSDSLYDIKLACIGSEDSYSEEE